LELLTGAVALAGDVLRVFMPVGSLLRADPNAPADTPFSDWRLPGVLLAVLVGARFRLTGILPVAQLPVCARVVIDCRGAARRL
jgi:ABC-type enterobactin transport system permease subunit